MSLSNLAVSLILRRSFQWCRRFFLTCPDQKFEKIVKRPIVFRWYSSLFRSQKSTERIEVIEPPWTLDNTGRGARFARSVLKMITIKLLQRTKAWFITSRDNSYCNCDGQILQVATGTVFINDDSYYKLRHNYYWQITTEHCKEIFFNTNKFLTVAQGFCNPLDPFVGDVCC